MANSPAGRHNGADRSVDGHHGELGGPGVRGGTYGHVPHPGFGITGGDGLHVVWEEVAGTARAKWLLWTGERIDAQIALQWGVVNEVVAHDWAADRGIEIAPGPRREAGSLPPAPKANAQRQPPRRIIQDVPFGMALEGLTAADLTYQKPA